MKSPKKLKVVNYIYYKGLVLSEALLKNVLTGGKGVFELTNGEQIYSVCFALSRRRQKAKGYP